MNLGSNGMSNGELADLTLSDAEMARGLELIAREHPQIVEAVTLGSSVMDRRQAIANTLRGFASQRGISIPHVDIPYEAIRSLSGVNRRRFFGLSGLIVASLAAAGCSPRMNGVSAFADHGYDTPRSLHWPRGEHITREDYPPLNSAISEDVPGDWDRLVSQGRPGNIDIAAKRDGSTKVVPAAKGDISDAGRTDRSGWFVIMRHGLGYATIYAHLASISGRILKNGQVQRELVLTPEDEIGIAGNTGSNAKGYTHLGFLLIVPPYAQPNNPFPVIYKNMPAQMFSANPARFAEYCVVGKNVGGSLVKICTNNINYRQTGDFDNGLWERDKEYREFRGELRKELGMSRKEFRDMRQSAMYYHQIALLEEQLERRFDGKLSPSVADSYLKELLTFKNFRGPILTAPIMNPHRPDLYIKQ